MVSVLLIAGGAVKGHCQCHLCMQVSVLKKVAPSGSGNSNRRLLHGVAAWLVNGRLPPPAFLQEEVESSERHFDLPSGCEESLSNPYVSVWVTGEGWEGQAMLQRDVQS